MSPAWRWRAGWVRLDSWEKRWAAFAGVTSRSLGDMKDVVVFRRQLARAGLDPARWAGGRQVHGRRVVAVGRPRAEPLDRVDGVVTRSTGLALRVFTADCVPVFLMDPVRRAAGLVHAGRRGVHKGIAASAIRRMTDRYGTRPGDVHAAFGPHLQSCCYDVGPEVAALFESTAGAVVGGGPRSARRFRLNLAAVLRAQLRGAGVAEERITPAPACTACHPEFYSYRRDGTEQRQAAVVCLARSLSN